MGSSACEIQLTQTEQNSMVFHPDQVDVRDQLRQAENSLWKTQLAWMEQVQLRKINQKRRGPVVVKVQEATKKLQDATKELADLDALDQQLTVLLDSIAASVEDHQKILASTRYWGTAEGFKDLPDELLNMILTHLGFTQQQRLARICRRWKCMVMSEIAHIYVDFVHGKEPVWNMVLFMMVKRPNKYPAVRQLTCNVTARARYHADGDANSYEMGVLRDMTSLFPHLSAVNIIHLYLDLAPKDFDKAALMSFMSFPSPVSVTLYKCGIGPWPSTVYRTLATSFALEHWCSANLDGELVFAALLDGLDMEACVIRAPTLTFTPASMSEYEVMMDRAVWLYPDEQLHWLARYAPSLSQDTYRLVKFLRGFVRATFVGCQNTDCQSRDAFCEHLVVDFYRHHLEGRTRNLLSLCILRANIPGVEAPPFAFDFINASIRGVDPFAEWKLLCKQNAEIAGNMPTCATAREPNFDINFLTMEAIK